jgi:hypothetical protein
MGRPRRPHPHHRRQTHPPPSRRRPRPAVFAVSPGSFRVRTSAWAQAGCAGHRGSRRSHARGYPGG